MQLGEGLSLVSVLLPPPKKRKKESKFAFKVAYFAKGLP